MYFYDVIPLGQRLFKPYTYKYEKKLEIGQRVVIDLRGKYVQGLVYRESNDPKVVKIKNIEFPLDERSYLSDSHIKLIEKASDYFLAPMGEIAKLLFPPASSDLYKLKIVPLSELAPFDKPIFYKDFLRLYKDNSTANKALKELLSSNVVKLDLHKKSIRENKDYFIILNMDLSEIWNHNLSKSARNLVNYLAINGETLESELYDKGIINRGTTVLKTLQKKGIIKAIEDTLINSETEKVTLTEEQKSAVDFIKKHDEKPHLLYGVTGSGKTEVFFEVGESVLEKGGKLLILVPEISLTSEIMSRLKKRFSKYRAAFYHSSLTSSERVDTWYKAVEGDLDIVIGTRSAVWLPIKDLRMIIIDEEHDQSFYQIENVTYDAIEVALFRKELENIQLILSSATPRIIDIKRAKDNEMHLETIVSRYFSEMPEVEIIDMKKEEKYNWIFSKKVIDSIRDVVAKNKKVIVFTPTRGYANYVVCSECGYIFKCDNCDVSLTFHKKERKLICHYCGNEQELPNFCPKCGGFKLQSRGYGTERVITELTKLFPSEPIVRVDRTVIKTFDDLKNTFTFMKEPGRKIIVGTKMITKGLDIKDLDLVVILDSDRYTHMPDYNARESTASLIMQVAGRSGRKEKGKVIIQSFDPNNEVYKAAINHDYTFIAEKELEQREKYKYPPFTKLFLIMVSNRKMENVKSISQDLINELGSVIDNKQVELLGPVTPIISKLRGDYRLQIILKVFQEDTSFLMPIVEKYDKDIKVYVNPPTTIL